MALPHAGGPAGWRRSRIEYLYIQITESQFVNTDAHHPSFRYRLDEDATAIGDFTMYSDTGGLVIERDSEENDKALLKKVYKVDLDKTDEDGFLIKTLVADLLDIDDPHDLNQDGEQIFHFLSGPSRVWLS